MYGESWPKRMDGPVQPCRVEPNPPVAREIDTLCALQKRVGPSVPESYFQSTREEEEEETFFLGPS